MPDAVCQPHPDDLRDLFESDRDVPVTVRCDCGYEHDFWSIERFKELDAENQYLHTGGSYCMDELAKSRFLVGCPGCDHVWKGYTRILDDGEPTILFSSDPDDKTVPPACPRCTTVLDWCADRYEGPGAPEVGWEYYECPDCDHQMTSTAIRTVRGETDD